MNANYRGSTIATRLAIAALGVLLAWHAFGFAQTAVRAIGYPYELDYGEGIVWFQMKQLFAGEAFGDIHQFGGVVFHYTPFYHFVSGLLAATGIDGLAAGRIVSVVSTAAMMVLIWAIVRRVLVQGGIERQAASLSGAIAGLALLLCFSVKVWAPLMRVDMLAFALTLGGLLCAFKAIERPKLIHASAILFVLAVYTKQTMIAAPAAVFAVLLLYRPRTALAGIATCLVAGSIALGALAYATHGGFLRHIFLYNVNRLDPDRANWIGLIVAGHFPLITAGLTGAALTLPSALRFAKRRGAADANEAVAAILIVYLVLTTIGLLLILKSGSGVNYFIEWMAALAIFAGIAIAPAAQRAFDSEAAIGQPAAFAGKLTIISLAVQAMLLPATRYEANAFTGRLASLGELTERIRAADKPVISDDMVELVRAGKPVVWEPAIFAELGSNGMWDEKPFIRMIEEKRFAFFVTNQTRGGYLFDQRYNPAVAEAIDKAYPRQEKLSGLTLHYPE